MGCESADLPASTSGLGRPRGGGPSHVLLEPADVLHEPVVQRFLAAANSLLWHDTVLGWLARWLKK